MPARPSGRDKTRSDQRVRAVRNLWNRIGPSGDHDRYNGLTETINVSARESCSGLSESEALSTPSPQSIGQFSAFTAAPLIVELRALVPARRTAQHQHDGIALRGGLQRIGAAALRGTNSDAFPRLPDDSLQNCHAVFDRRRIVAGLTVHVVRIRADDGKRFEFCLSSGRSPPAIFQQNG